MLPTHPPPQRAEAFESPFSLLPPRNVLLRSEEWWRDHQEWLAGCGYMLRPRYRPGWVPSWTVTQRRPHEEEDGQLNPRFAIFDAVRIQDNLPVILKRLVPKVGLPDELPIHKFLRSPSLSSQPGNHCVPLLDVLQVPDGDKEPIIVLPVLRPYDRPGFETNGQVVDFIGQVLTGLQFMHHNGIAHGDCTKPNIMMDATPLYPHGFHPISMDMRRDWAGSAPHLSRVEQPVTYYFIDFGLSRQYPVGTVNPLAPPIRGADYTAPEHQLDTPCNPFCTDIYYVGNLLRKEFVQGCLGFGFLEPLVMDMVNPNPSSRLGIDDVLSRFQQICGSISPWKLRMPLVYRDEHITLTILRSLGVLVRSIGFASFIGGEYF